ncbi:hypothetical protein [Sphingomonas sp.]|uniref:hypothetical protein n=1 Tax=Sphingomonas sp. TaxID=28214 RepID=UPI0025DA23E6|nr:hypothetical protein [Sphingomonas sp.]
MFLRLAGVALLVLAWLTAVTLRARVLAVPAERDGLAYFLAAATFLSASGGTLLATLGRHVFDRVEVARRWSRYVGD